MILLFIGAHDEVRAEVDGVVRHDLHTLQTNRGGRARDKAGLPHFVGRRETELVGLKHVAELDLIDLQVASQCNEHQVAVGYVEDGLEGLTGGDAQKGSQRLDRLDAGGVDLLQRLQRVHGAERSS